MLGLSWWNFEEKIFTSFLFRVMMIQLDIQTSAVCCLALLKASNFLQFLTLTNNISITCIHLTTNKRIFKQYYVIQNVRCVQNGRRSCFFHLFFLYFGDFLYFRKWIFNTYYSSSTNTNIFVTPNPSPNLILLRSKIIL